MIRSGTKGAQRQREKRAVKLEIKSLKEGEGDARCHGRMGICHVEPWRLESARQMSQPITKSITG